YQLEILPAIVQPQDDELLSSWIFRLAEINATKVHTFCKRYFPLQQVWNRDIDRLGPRAMLHTLSKITTIDYPRLLKSTFSDYEGFLFKELNSNGNSKWIMPLGIYHRTRKRFGLQFCPQCLIKDGNRPYFRKSWRLSLSIVCPVCRLKLY